MPPMAAAAAVPPLVGGAPYGLFRVRNAVMKGGSVDILSTYAASERMFSSSGFVNSPTRNRLSPDTLELCVLVTSALRNGIDLREGVRRLKEEKKTGANAKRSASMKAVRAAKKAKATAAAAVSEEIVLDEDEDGEDDDGDEEEGPRAAELELAVKVAALLAEEEAGEW